MHLLKPMAMASHVHRRFVSKLATYRPSSPMPNGPARGQLPPALKEGEPLQYHVSRTKSLQLPVYQDLKNSNRKLTLVRKIVGDVGLLKRELQEFIGLADDRITINDLTKHIVIKGWHKSSVVRFLEARKL